MVVATSQVATAIAGAAIGPAVNGITLGIVRQAGFNRQNGRNQAFNHAGNMVGAALSGFLGWQFGFTAIFVLAAIFGAASIVSVLMIPAKAIDDGAARGMKEGPDSAHQVSGFKVLIEVQAAAHPGRRARLLPPWQWRMLPLYGLAFAAEN